MVRPKTEEEIALMRENGLLVSRTLAEVGKIVAPGVSTLELNRVAETFIRDNGAIPSFLGYDGFPYALCISVNDGLSSDRVSAFLRWHNLPNLSLYPNPYADRPDDCPH